jgi:iron complex outermembrane receptor protein
MFASYQGSSGNFEFYDDRATFYNPSDDRLQIRQNNAFNAGLLRLILETDLPKHSVLRFTNTGTLKAQGIPGVGNAPTWHTHASEGQLLSRLELQHALLANAHWIVSVGTDLLVSRRSFQDPNYESGLTTGKSNASLWQWGLDARHEIVWTNTHKTEISPRLAIDHYKQSGAQNSPSTRAQAFNLQRVQLGLGAEHALQWGSLKIVPSMRLDSILDSQATLQTSPRLAASYTLSPCELHTSVGRFHRFATLIERYGDGLLIVPSPKLQPEYGVSADLGTQCAVKKPFAFMRSAQFLLTGFSTFAYDLIVLQQTAQNYFRADNLGKNQIIGLETSSEQQWLSYLASGVAYTLTQALNKSSLLGENNKRTPGIALHRLDGNLTLGPKTYSVRYEISLISQSYLDKANLLPIAPRVFQHAFATVSIPKTGFALQLAVRNLTNVRHESMLLNAKQSATRAVTDFLNYPLPGRSWFLSIMWRM